MKGKQLMDIINSGSKIFANVDSLFTPLKVKVDCDDLRDEVIYMCQGNMEVECGIKLVPHKSGAFELAPEDDKLLPKSA